MNNHRKFTVLGKTFIAGTVLAVLSFNQSLSAESAFSGNQLMKGSSHWYEKAAVSVKPVPGIKAKTGALLVLQSESYLYMEGNSTLHKYQMNANALLGSAAVNVPAGGNLLKALQGGNTGSMVLTIPVMNLKSRESGLNDNAYKALKAKENPEIKFALNKVTLKTGKDDGDYFFTAKGDLTIAGTTAPVALSGTALVKDGRVEFKGVQKLKMTDFKVAPPSISLLVTAITCSDEIEVHYDVVFAPGTK
jgi:hypothetical protein